MKTHPTDPVSLVSGLLLVAIAAVAIGGGLTVDVLSAEWVWPSALVLLGLLVLATAGLGRRGQRATDDEVAAARPEADDEVAAARPEAENDPADVAESSEPA